MAKPNGLKIFKQLFSQQMCREILSQKEFQQQEEADAKLFRLYGNFGNKPTADPEPWMIKYGEWLHQ